ncbi:MAG: cell wall-active antibiotics response protein [Firmicutes bacterium]|mgnify:CR=1 FL=1|nr:cell wall-active antibiotics response protein [Bacillota bacterium]
MEFDKSKSLFGIIIICFGVILLLNNFGYLQLNPVELIVTYWPVLLITWGLQSLWTGSRSQSAQLVSAFTIILGVILLTNNLDWVEINVVNIFKFFFPVLIILIGISVFSGRTFVGKSTLAILGAVERGKTSSWQLETGSYVAVMGGIELDLRHAVIPEGETVLDLTAVMGGIDIRVPANLHVIADGLAVFGGIEFFGKGSGGIIGSLRNEQLTEENQTAVLRIQARAVMGGIDIKRI